MRNHMLKGFSAIIVVALLMLGNIANAQFKPIDTANTAAKIAKLRGTFIKDTLIAGQLRPMYTGKKGGKFIIVTAKSGNVYRRYFKQ